MRVIHAVSHLFLEAPGNLFIDLRGEGRVDSGSEFLQPAPTAQTAFPGDRNHLTIGSL